MDFDVIVVGSGPSGLTVAAEVAAAGLKVVVLERRTDVVESRAGTLLPRVLELLDTRGVADRFIRKAREIRHWPFNPSHIWAGLQPVDWSSIESRFGFTLLVPQNLTEEVLGEWAQEKGIDLRMGHEVTNLEVASDRCRVWVRSADGSESVLTSSYIVGADGARSIVRKTLGIPFDGTDPSFTGIIADAVMDWPFEQGLKMIGNDLGWGSCFPFGDRIVRFSIVHAERRHADRSEPVTLDEFKACVTDIYGSDLGCEGLAWSSRYTDQMRCVPDLQQGRAFLVGESSRIHYPSSGVGMNFCIQDAFNLGWKLAFVLKGHAPSDLLSTYNTERMLIIDDLLDSVRRQCAIQFDFEAGGMAVKADLENRFMTVPEINRRIALELNGLSSPYPAGPGSHPAAGYRAIDLDLILLDGSTSRLHEQLHEQQFALLDFTGLGLFRELEGAEASLKVVEAKPVKLAEAHKKLTALLVRPDGYVAWASEGRPTAAEAKSAFDAALRRTAA